MPSFSHLHVHSQFSLLDGAASINSMLKKAVQYKMPAIALTDHGNMFGAFEFVAAAAKLNKSEDGHKIKPIIGCEFYMVADRFKKQFTKTDRDVRYHQLLLAKNEEGYRNLVKLCSLGFIDGFYGKYPRIDKSLILQHHKGLIATTCCLGAEVPKTILHKGEAAGEEVFKWWLDLFGEDYYIEVQRHGIPEQNKVNEILLKWSLKYNVKVIASNDSHYTDREDANAHDILLCINTGEKKATPTQKEFSDDESAAKGTRFAFYNDEFYFKTPDEMAALFADIPQAIDNTNEIVAKVETLSLEKEVILPFFQCPTGFQDQYAYLEHLTWQGAKERYKELTPEIEERVRFELFTIKTMKFEGYFLIVADFINHGKHIGVMVGPGRGSAAGSVVAYCIGITNIDPIKYGLLFERFLNPDRKSLPDIDTDFDDEGRQKVIDYVVEKYGKNQVAQIVTYGTMAAKMSIKDVARVLDLPLADANSLAKLVPEKPGISLKKLLKEPIDTFVEKEGLDAQAADNIKKLKNIYQSNSPEGEVLKEAEKLEGSVRNTGIHAAGIIIAPHDLTEILPVAVAKDSDLLVTQFEGKVIENAGVIKMDFLGLKNLSIIKEALLLIQKNHNITIAIDAIPLNDSKTFEMYQKGETNGTFQFESPGMQKYLRDLKPDKFEDLIAMNALYRPGPLQYIPEFIDRKHGRKPIIYDLPEMEEYLADTYGITVYQEQVMLLSQKLAGFSKGDADVLRKAMGKKDKKTLDNLKDKFLNGATANGHPKETLEKIWSDWEHFAQYAFNKSHSTCYAFVAYQTMYLKANYTAEYMAANLTQNQNNIDKLSFYMEECKRMAIPVLGPSINESTLNFTVNKKGEIRFGLGGIKGVGEGPVEAIEEERKNGAFTSIFDFAARANLRVINKKTLESLALSGALDEFVEIPHRAVYLASEPGNQDVFIDKLIKYGNQKKDIQTAGSLTLFGNGDYIEIPTPTPPKIESWSLMEKLKKERDVVGIYLSGHPLDTYNFALKPPIINTNLKIINALQENPEKLMGRKLIFPGIISVVNVRKDKRGQDFVTFNLEDFTDTLQITLFNQNYLKFQHMLQVNQVVMLIAEYVKHPYREQHFDLNIAQIEVIDDYLNKKIQALQCSFSLESLTNERLETLNNVLSKYKGPKKVVFEIEDQEGNIEKLSSTLLKVDIDKALFQEVQGLKWISNLKVV